MEQSISGEIPYKKTERTENPGVSVICSDDEEFGTLQYIFQGIYGITDPIKSYDVSNN